MRCPRSGQMLERSLVPTRGSVMVKISGRSSGRCEMEVLMAQCHIVQCFYTRFLWPGSLSGSGQV